MKKKEKFKIESADQLGGTDLNYYVARAWVETCDMGAATKNYLPFNWDDKALYVNHRGMMIAIIVWKNNDWQKTIHLKLGWVHRGSRRLGVYSKLYRKLRKIRDEKYKDYTITGGVVTDNLKIMQSLMDKFERKAVATIFDDKPEKGKITI